MITGLHHVALKVADVRNTKWLDHIGLGSQGSWIVCPNVYVRVIGCSDLDAGSSRNRPVNRPGIAHICLQSRDIEEGLALGVAAGLAPVSGPVDLGTQFRYLYAHTSDGILLELEGAPFVCDVEPRFWVGHVAFVAKDIVPLVEFYGRALGLNPSPVSRLHPNALFDKVAGLTGVDLSAMWLPGLNLGLEFWQYHHPPAPTDQRDPTTGFTHLCFECDDLEADCAHVLAQGATPDAQVEFGLLNCKTACFRDPEGNSFSLLAFDSPQHPMATARLPNRSILDAVAAQQAARREAL
jgi:catechol 2,3-dioxygenase-like lactoylglutathione lyase family enzyme